MSKAATSRKISRWLTIGLSKDVQDRVRRMSECDDVVRIAIMPDVHLAKEYCVGTVVATRSRIMPQAVGGDIGCGMAAVRVDERAERLATRDSATKLLQLLHRFVPSNKHGSDTVSEQLPDVLAALDLSDPRLEKYAARDGRFQLGTLGRGNHFLEFQADQEGVLWMMIHSGSRAMGQRITEYHLRNAVKDTPLAYIEADSDEGRAYLNDVAWAREYARQNRLSMLRMASELLRTLWSVDIDERSLIESDHNHVLQEIHFGEQLWVHRKGAQSAALGESGVIPGSMGTASYHVVGRGCAESMNSASHGAGRALSRSDARSSVSVKALRRQMGSVFFDGNKAAAIRDEAPSAYKDIRRVMKAQRELVKIVRMVKPLISYKGV